MTALDLVWRCTYKLDFVEETRDVNEFNNVIVTVLAVDRNNEVTVSL